MMKLILMNLDNNEESAVFTKYSRMFLLPKLIPQKILCKNIFYKTIKNKFLGQLWLQKNDKQKTQQ